MTDIPGYDTIRWENDQVMLIDQRRLPGEEIYLTCTDYREVVDAIRTLAIRGAPAIGVAAAMAAALGALSFPDTTGHHFQRHFHEICQVIGAARPTAVNLTWALAHLEKLVAAHSYLDTATLKTKLVAEAQAMLQEDIAINRRMGAHGQALIQDGDSVLTHCNAGGLATGGYGTAIGVIRAAWEAGKKIHVFVDETRPILQGARLTAWELSKLGIPYTLIPDNAAASLMAKSRVNCIVVGADRIAANGDVANKIGTYGVAVWAYHHQVPFYVAAPVSTFDFTLIDGSQIPIEERDPTEITEIRGCRIAPETCRALNLAFDITPNRLITGIITEKGVCSPPLSESVAALQPA
jgi:methylthioribose-1-phosphate isomerase